MAYTLNRRPFLLAKATTRIDAVNIAGTPEIRRCRSASVELQIDLDHLRDWMGLQISSIEKAKPVDSRL
jgi:hypothetical protein